MQNSEGSRAPRRADIQGLRGVAVIAVVLYHAGVPHLGGGLVGVDIFFALSGYVITNNLLREFETTGSIRLRRFVARRVLRLAPAALVVIAAFLVVAKVTIAPLLLPGIGRDAVTSIFGVTNVSLAFAGTDYLASKSPSLFQHFWSLGVEEQFYLLWPALLFLLLIVFRSRRRLVALALLLLVIVSFCFCLWQVGTSQPWAFFGLASRAWELGMGALLALTISRIRLRPAVATTLGAAGTLAVILSIVGFNSTTVFPGMATLVPVAGTLAIIMAGSGRIPSLVSRGLAWRPLVLVGNVSYSLYLWHWPLLVLPAVISGRQLSTPLALCASSLALVFATASYVAIERPVSKWSRLSPRTAVGGATVAVALTLILAATVSNLPRLATNVEVGTPTAARVLQGPHSPSFVPLDVTPSLLSAADDLPSTYSDGCHLPANETVSPDCRYGDPDAPEAGGIVLFGDSHAAQWFSPLNSAAQRRNESFIGLTKSACPAAAVAVTNPSLGRHYSECDVWRNNALARITAIKPRLVVLSSNAAGYREATVSSQAFEEQWRHGLASTLERIPTNTQIIVLGDTPLWESSPTVCLSEHLSDVGRCSERAEALFDERIQGLERQIALRAGARYVSVRDWLCTDRCQPMLWNALVYRDTNHLTDHAASLLEPRIDRLIQPASRTPR